LHHLYRLLNEYKKDKEEALKEAIPRKEGFNLSGPLKSPPLNV